VVNAITIEPPSTLYSVHLESIEDTGATTNYGTIIFDGTSYTLPDDISEAVGTYQVQYTPSSGYVFDRWETSGDVSISGLTVTVAGDGTVRAIYKVAQPSWFFDFGTPTSPVESGYTRVTESTVYSSAVGYGWNELLDTGRDRGAPDYLRRDLNSFHSDRTFNVDLADGDYQVTVIIGDQNYMHDQIDVYAEDILVINDLTAAAGSFQQETFGTTVTDGQLNIRIHDNGGTDPNWIINSLIIEADV